MEAVAIRGAVLAAGQPRSHLVAVHHQQRIVGFDARRFSGIPIGSKGAAYQALDPPGPWFVGVGRPFKQVGKTLGMFELGMTSMARHQAAREGNRLGSFQLFAKFLRHRRTALEPVVELVCQCHCVRRHDKPWHRLHAQRFADFLGKDRRPQALDGGERAEMLAFPGPCRPVVSDTRPQRIVTPVQRLLRETEPFALPGQGISPA